MRNIQAWIRLAAVFCTACISAELIVQLCAGTRLRQCIKAAAGLYILLSVLRAWPAFPADAFRFTPPEVPLQDYEALEDTIRMQTEKQLAKQMEALLAQNIGRPVQLSLVLSKTENTVEIEAVTVYENHVYSERKKEEISMQIQNYFDVKDIYFTE